VEYNECKVIAKLKKKKEPLISVVPIDEFTTMVQNNFDYTFTGESKFYPYMLPTEIANIDFNILAIVGASGSGKSTLCKEFAELNGGGTNLTTRSMIARKQSYQILKPQKKRVLS
jgi:ABC-type glutathione transport system ATPase component